MAAFLILTLAFPATPNTNEWVEFVGFSHDERIAAYRHDIRQPRRDGTIDQYSVFHTVDVATGFEVGAFRGTAIERVTADGRPVRVPKAELLDENPVFASAYPNKRWRQLKRRSRFFKHMVSPEDAAVKVTSSLDNLGREVNERGLYFANPGIVVFEVFGDQTGSKPRSLGRFYHKDRKSQIIARLQVFTSKTGRASAAAVVFLVNDGITARGVPLIKVTRGVQQLACGTPAPAPTLASHTPKSREQLEDEQMRRLDSLYDWMTGSGGRGSVRP